MAGISPAGWAEVVAGIAIVLVLPRTARERRDALLGVIPLLALGVVAYALIDRLFQMR